MTLPAHRLPAQACPTRAWAQVQQLHSSPQAGRCWLLRALFAVPAEAMHHALPAWQLQLPMQLLAAGPRRFPPHWAATVPTRQSAACRMQSHQCLVDAQVAVGREQQASHVFCGILCQLVRSPMQFPCWAQITHMPCIHETSDRSIGDRVYLAALEAAGAGSCSALPFASRSFSSARWRPFGGAREEPAGSDPVLLSNTEQ